MPGCTSPTSRLRPGRPPLDRGAAERAFSTYVPGLVAPMLPPELADDAVLAPAAPRPALRHRRDPARRGRDGQPLFYRSVIRSDARLTYGQAQRARPAAIARASVEALARGELAAELRRRRFARGALRIETRRDRVRVRRDGGVADAWLETRAARARARRGADDPRQRGASQSCSPAAAARRSTASTSGPTRSRSRSCSRSWPISACRRRRRRTDAPPQQAARRSRARSRERVTEYVDAVGRGREAFPALVLRVAQAGALRPAEPRPLRPREPRVLPLHVADPPLPGPRRPPRAPARARRLGTIPSPEDLAELAEHTSAREREAAQIEYRADDICLAWLLDRPALRARLGRAVRRRDHRPDRLRPLRPLRRRVRGVPPGAAAAAATSSS